MHILTAAQVRAWDHFTIQHEPISSIDLMERVATACFKWLKDNGYLQRKFIVFCGPGNNGGDGLAIARMLVTAGSTAEVFLFSPDRSTSPDYKTNLDRAKVHQATIHPIKTLEDIPIQFENETVIIDALFGSGLNKPLTGKAAALVAILNSCPCEIISIDLPSGLHPDQQSRRNIRVRALHTLTFQCYKPGLLLAENADSFGFVHILDIGLLPSFFNEVQTTFTFLDASVIYNIYKRRDHFSHKGDHGHAGLVTGSIGLMGAATLCASGCMRSGVGKLTCYVPRIGYEIIQIAVPEAMASVSGNNNVENFDPVAEHEAIGIGPGIGYGVSPELFRSILLSASRPMVLDADALTMLSKHTELFESIPKNSILTPHPKEFDRIFGEMKNDFERVDKAISKAKELKLIIVLKGHHTLIATPDGQAFFNSTGNAGMATGGSGDVLCGIITGLLAQGYSPTDAALLGVYLHGLAGDLAAKELSQEGMIAGDLVTYLPKAFLTLTPTLSRREREPDVLKSHSLVRKK